MSSSVKDTPVHSVLAANLRKAREAAGLTLEEAAPLIGLTNQAINQWEMGKTRPSVKNLTKAAEVYKTTIHNIVAPGSEIKNIADYLYRAEKSFQKQADIVEPNTVSSFGSGLRIEGEVAAGRWIEMQNDIEEEIAYQDIYDNVPTAVDPRWPKNAQYGLIVRGTSINKIATDGDVLSCVNIYGTTYKLKEMDLVIVEQRRDAGLLVERTAKRWLELDDRYELWPDSDDPRWQSPIVVAKQVGFESENEDGVSVFLKAFVTWIHRPVPLPVRRKR